MTTTHAVKTCKERNALISKAELSELIKSRRLRDGECMQDMFARIAVHYADTGERAQALYDIISTLGLVSILPL